jgi:CRISPR-associated endonuclease/helicase Cas3
MFAHFVAEVHTPPDATKPRGRFPWQQDLLRRIIAEKRWPDVIDVPTGLGKTSVLDVAVFAAAMGLPVARRRIYFVVDRRLVVDEAHEHAERIAAALGSPVGPVVRAVADALRQPGDDGPVLDVTRMRGGVTWDWVWLERPDRYAIVTGTVDQVGSRLLFRGYGVGENARSIDAALVGTDSLIVVDEAHIAKALLKTVTSALDMDQPTEDISLPRPVVVSMSATSAAADDMVVHGITDADVRHPVAGARLRAAKSMRLIEVSTTKAKASEAVADALAALAMQLLGERVTGVVVNTVARARAVFQRLQANGVEAVLLTGRSRPVDREYLLAEHYHRMSVNRERGDRRSFVVVATQTVEVGANIDLDALVTESAPLSSLVQRFGRLNRLAKCADLPAPAIVVHDSTVDEEDPVYGPARLNTWNWLSTIVPPERYSAHASLADGAECPASPAALRDLLRRVPPEVVETLQVVEPYVPVLWKSVLDTWVRTSPTPRPDQPVAPFLHGISRPRQSVTLVWRAGLEGDPATWEQVVESLPPATDEGLELDLRTARRWLMRSGTDLTESDLEAARDSADEEVLSGRGSPRRVLRFVKRGQAEIIEPDRIRPGDTVVLPCTYGGCDRYGWHPESGEPVVDVSDLARRKRRMATLRIGPTLTTVVSTWHRDAAGMAMELLDLASEPLPETSPDRYRTVLGRLYSAVASGEGRPESPFGRVVSALVADGAMLRVTSAAYVDDQGKVVDPGYAVLLSAGRSLFGDDDSEAGSSAARKALKLDPHQRAVAARARQFAKNLGLSDPIKASVEAAARWHDEGKRDIRFQAMLHHGDRRRADLAAVPLAKSGMDPADRPAFRRALHKSGYPVGMRHEALSARIVAVRLAEFEEGDRELVIHLIACHHGRGRPLLPPVVDKAPVRIEVESGETFDSAETMDWAGPRRFAGLNAAYGRWGLALLEAVVRLADIWCSARDEEEP